MTSRLSLEADVVPVAPAATLATATAATLATGTDATEAAVPKHANVVIVEWSDLIQSCTNDNDDDNDGDNQNDSRMLEVLEQAYGATNGATGILCIRGLPGFVAAKEAFLSLAHTLAVQLTPEYRDTHLTDPVSLYNAGWSHGKEKLGAHKPPDTAKGSFYYNPVTDTPGSEADRAQYPVSYPCNVWPDADVMPDFQEKAVAIGLLLKDACVAVARHMDALALAKQPSYTKNLLYDSLKNTDKVKARLLYYFPLPLPLESTTSTSSTTGSITTDTKDDALVDQDSWVCI
jgi:hypothetical protein